MMHSDTRVMYLLPGVRRILLLSKARWHTAHQSCSTSRQASLSTRKLTYGYGSTFHAHEPRTDIVLQSLGCTLYALAYLHSPFETTQTTEQGGSIAMAVMNAQYKQPSSAYSQGLRDLIDSMLKADPQQRPDIHQVCF